ncbi:tail fiber assembly protein [Morganella morganii]|uniref:tail fiber assembly protein n=1 Tax=Morganella morganii TaxID=582 RepID=UPI00298DB577|nr:tail fiber assembly protein [Morganella morganii]MDW7796077.1 tail fiber assembly protein [Morganella morganii]
MVIYFSATTCWFYPLNMKQDYIDAGSWPDDAVEMTDKEKETYWTKQPPSGKQLGGDKKGRPAWVNIPPLTKEQAIFFAEERKQFLIMEVSSETEMLRTKLALKRIKPDEEALLIAWLDYLDELEAVDVSTAPDIIWPVKPVV